MIKWLRLLLIPVLLLVVTQSSGVINANPAGHFGTVDSAGNWQHTSIQKQSKTALLFKSNGVSGSDVRIVWDGDVFFPRETHTVIWQAKYVQQTGYYALIWHDPNLGYWSAPWSYGTHPYPAADGAVGSNGNTSSPTYSSGTVHYYEIANGNDLLSTSIYDLAAEGQSAQESLITTKDVWVTQARTSEVVGDSIRHVFYPDLVNRPDFKIAAYRTIAALGTTPSNPLFYAGASKWTASGTANVETPSCYFRGLKMYSAALSLADILTESAAETNIPQTSAGSASLFYSNINPTVDDVTDKSGNANHPRWDNANRPSDFTL